MSHQGYATNAVVQISRSRPPKAAQLASQAFLADLPEHYRRDLKFALALTEILDAPSARARTALLIYRQLVADLAGIPVHELMRRFDAPTAKSTSHL